LYTAGKSALLFMQQMLCLSSETHVHINHIVACRSPTSTAENKNQKAKSLLATALGLHMQSHKQVNRRMGVYEPVQASSYQLQHVSRCYHNLKGL